MFIARERELQVLRETYEKPGFQMTVIYGRRRIGKSRLITEFIKGKKASYYIAARSDLKDNVKKWGAQLLEDLASDLSGVEFNDLESLFKFIASNSKGEKLVLALDEIPYIAEADDSFLSRFQVAIDTILSKENIYLIVSGSAISFMEKEILAEKSPLFGRRTNQIFLQPFDYRDSAKFVPNYTNEEKAIVYGITGGVAKYLTLFDDSISLDQNIINNYFKSSGYLYEEPYNLLTQEFRTVNAYNSIIEACAGGANKVNEMASKTLLSTAAVTYIIKNLMTIGVLSKISAITEEENKKKTNYEITDGMYRFWYTFIPRARTSIEMGKGEVFYNEYVKGNLHDFMAETFEQMCRYYTILEGLDGKLDSLVTKAGKWWGTDHNQRQTDIDVVAIDEIKKKAILGECKFRNEQVDKTVYEAFMEKRGLISRKYEEVQYLFFSLSGYSKWVLENADKNEVKLFTLDNLFE